MKPIKTIIFGASVLAISLGAISTTNHAHAVQGTSEYVKDVDLEVTGYAPKINIENVSSTSDINDLDLEVQDSNIEFTFNGKVDCKWNATLRDNTNKIHFGPVSIDRDGKSVSTIGTLYKQNSIYLGEVGGVIENGDETFTIPLNQIKNGHPAVRVDPLAELEKARQAFNGTDLEFYKQDREIVLQRPLSVTAICAKKTNSMKFSAGYETQNGTIQIKYKGDPSLKIVPKLNAQLGQGGGAQGGFNAGDQPLKITSMSFQPNMPHHIGACPDSKTIRVFFSGQGEGEVKIRINDGGNTIHQSGNIPFDAKNGQHHYDFDMDAPAVSQSDINKTFKHDLKVHVIAKDDDEVQWPSNYELKDQDEWKRRCTPQLNPNLGGNNGGIGGYQDNNDGGNINLDKLQVQPVKPKRAKIN